tara:strand:+ start:2087 stop:2305 length:219 start_codon:yes stop_codon:yes gene_type:complete
MDLAATNEDQIEWCNAVLHPKAHRSLGLKAEPHAAPSSQGWALHQAFLELLRSLGYFEADAALGQAPLGSHR